MSPALKGKGNSTLLSPSTSSSAPTFAYGASGMLSALRKSQSAARLGVLSVGGLMSPSPIPEEGPTLNTMTPLGSQRGLSARSGARVGAEAKDETSLASSSSSSSPAPELEPHLSTAPSPDTFTTKTQSHHRPRVKDEMPQVIIHFVFHYKLFNLTSLYILFLIIHFCFGPQVIGSVPPPPPILGASPISTSGNFYASGYSMKNERPHHHGMVPVPLFASRVAATRVYAKHGF
jgi:hypothetical protein